jgi:hypothetical protein
MRTWQTLALVPALVLAARAADKEPAKEGPVKAAEPGTLVVLDAAGKEQKLKAWKFASGTRRLGWLAPDRPADKPADKPGDKTPGRAPEAPAGPEALEFWAESEIHFVDGVPVTLIPLERLRALDYDADKETATARVAVGPEADETLTGSTKYKKFNKLVLEAEVDKGDLGVAEVRYLGGLPRGIKGIRFPPPKPPAARAPGRPAAVVTVDANKKTTHKVADLLPLYRLEDGGEKLLPTLYFRKTLKVDVGKVRKIVAADPEKDDAGWQVQLKDGSDETLVLLRAVEVEKRKAVLEGLVGRVPAGWMLFPVACVAEISFEPADTDK